MLGESGDDVRKSCAVCAKACPSNLAYKRMATPTTSYERYSRVGALSSLICHLYFSFFIFHFSAYFTQNIHMESPDPPTEGSIAPAMINEKQGPTAISQQISQDHVQEKWNSSTINIFRYLESLVAFVIMGVNDASLGVSEHTHTRQRYNIC